MTEEKMRKLFLFLVISVLAFCLASCGDETSQNMSENSGRQANGTVLNRKLVKPGSHRVNTPVFKKKIQLPPLNTQTWAPVATGQYQCFNNMQEVDCDEVPSSFSTQDGKKRYGTRSLTRDSNNETVTDSVTGLVWVKKVNTGLSWYEAKNYCDNLRLENKTWRLPTTAELRSIVNYGKTNPAIDQVFYDDASGNTGSDESKEMKKELLNWFWATKHVHFDSEGSSDRDYSSSWIVNFMDGSVEFTSRYNTYNVRCVSADF